MADTAEITTTTDGNIGYPTSPSPTTSYNHVHLNNTSSWPSLGTTSSVEASSQPSPPSISITVGLTIGIAASSLVLTMLLMILVVLLWTYARRKTTRQTQHSERQDSLHSTQAQSELATAFVNEQFHLNLSTEIISLAEKEATSNISCQIQADFH